MRTRTHARPSAQTQAKSPLQEQYSQQRKNVFCFCAPFCFFFFFVFSLRQPGRPKFLLAFPTQMEMRRIVRAFNHARWKTYRESFTPRKTAPEDSAFTATLEDTAYGGKSASGGNGDDRLPERRSSMAVSSPKAKGASGDLSTGTLPQQYGLQTKAALPAAFTYSMK